MTKHYLSRFFEPGSVAVIGASDRPGSLGQRVYHNLRTSGFKGKIYAVNPGHEQVQGDRSYPELAAIGEPVDLAVIASPRRTVLDVVEQCGQQDIRAVCVLSPGVRRHERERARFEKDLLERIRRYNLRLVGPDCIGLLRPHIGLNASDCRPAALPGELALVSQSAALCNAIVDWAGTRSIGFSTVVSLGDTLDVDFGDVLDFLAIDGTTRSILLYLEGVHNARRFMSGLRAAARIKPVIVMKAGRHREGSRAALSHTGALVGDDDVFDAALARAGAVRVRTIQQLFAAAQALSGNYRVRGNRLAIVTNGGGPAIIAADRAAEVGVALPQLGEKTGKRLEHLVPAQLQRQNPVDLLAKAGPDRYQQALEACLADEDIDGVLVMLAPQAQSDPDAVAERVIACAHERGHKPVLTCWLGEEQVQRARSTLRSARVPHFSTPEAAVEAFGYMASYHRNQQLLLQVPGPMSLRHEGNIAGARLIIESALEEGRRTLTSMEAKAVLTAFGIPVVRTIEAHSASEALVVAESLGYPVAMKISSPEIAHKSRIGGVRLDIANAHAVRAAYADLLAAAQAAHPGITTTRVTIERMHGKEHAREVIVGVARDPVFGPVISFGAGGTMVELIRDRAVALPPLNAFIARDLIRRTRVSRLLKAYQGMPAADVYAVEQVLLRVSDLVCKLPHIRELDINPLVVDEHGALAVDALFTIEKPPAAAEVGYGHMAVHPYPTELVGSLVLPDGTEVTVRPIRPEDAELEREFVQNLSRESRFFRFMETLNELSTPLLVRLTQIDYDREMALIAVQNELGREQQLGVARYTLNPDGESCEFAIAVADDWQHRGLGSRLLARLMETAAARGIRRIEGEVLANNHKMLKFMRKMGFRISTHPEDYTIKRVSKDLI